MTASNGPADVEQRTAQCDRLDTPAPVDGKGVGETGSSSFTASGPQGPGPRSWKTDQIRLSRWQDIRRGLGLQVSRRRPRLFSKPKQARGGGQLALVQVAALQTSPPRMQPSSLMVFASCNVRLPE